MSALRTEKSNKICIISRPLGRLKILRRIMAHPYGYARVWLLLPHELVDLVNHLVVGTLHFVEDAYADKSAD